jgi:probable HAF family extracellular repeat protein
MSHAARAAVLGATSLLPAAIAALLATPAFAATTYKYTTIAFPGAKATIVTGINASKTVSGTYTDASGTNHAFAWASGKFTTIASPTGTSINAAGINDANTVTGTYLDANGFYVGYIASKAGFTTIAVPAQNVTAGAIHSQGEVALAEQSYFGVVDDFTYLNGVMQTYFTTQYNAAPTGINTAGSIIGNYTNNSGQQVSYLYANGTSITLPATGTLSMSANAINTSGVVVGSYVSSATNATQGFTYSKGALTTVAEPGFTNTSLTGIDAAGDVIGSAWTTGGASGFMLAKGVYSQVIPPGATSVALTGINAKGVICGYFASASGTTGFIATP